MVIGLTTMILLIAPKAGDRLEAAVKRWRGRNEPEPDTEGGSQDRRHTSSGHAAPVAPQLRVADRHVEVRRIQQYLGHKSILSTVLYVDLAGRALDDIWDR